MSHLSLKVVSIKNFVSDENGHRFQAVFPPMFEGKRFGLVTRRKSQLSFRVHSDESIKYHFLKRHPRMAKILNQTDSSLKTLFVQSKHQKGKELFQVYVAKNLSDEKFREIVFNLVMDRRLWKWAINKDMLIELDGPKKTTTFYQNGKLMKPTFNFYERFKYETYGQRKNPYLLTDRVFQQMALLNPMKLGEFELEKISKFLAMLSDLHVGYKGHRTDNFGKEKEKALIRYLKTEIIPLGIPLLFGGDGPDLWENDINDILRTYPDLFKALGEVKNLFFIIGNHDKALADPDGEARKALLKVLPNANFLPYFYYQFPGVSLNYEHGDAADTFNNDNRLGFLITRMQMTFETMYNNISAKRNSASQRLEGAARSFMFSDLSAVMDGIVNPYDRFLALMKIETLFENNPKLGLLGRGHTHERAKHRDASSLLQSFFYGYQESAYSEIRRFFFDTGTWSGVDLKHEVLMNRKAWKDQKRNKKKALEVEKNEAILPQNEKPVEHITILKHDETEPPAMSYRDLAKDKDKFIPIK